MSSERSENLSTVKLRFPGKARPPKVSRDLRRTERCPMDNRLIFLY